MHLPESRGGRSLSIDPLLSVLRVLNASVLGRLKFQKSASVVVYPLYREHIVVIPNR